MNYKGFKVEVKKINGIYEMFVYRISDNWILDYGWDQRIKTKKDAIEECKIAIDDYYENPSNYED